MEGLVSVSREHGIRLREFKDLLVLWKKFDIKLNKELLGEDVKYLHPKQIEKERLRYKLFL